MPPQEQAALWMQLRDRMKVDWHEMTLQEKKAGMSYISPQARDCVWRVLLHLQLALYT